MFCKEKKGLQIQTSGVLLPQLLQFYKNEGYNFESL
jgi:hypothetical protein